ncbi:MAG: flagellar motor switch protein FliM [Gammaproteobacteria bacterium]|nr:MAG: flagellar motor switch protein FliM [Gammaproteobacteria bacterium]
MNEHLSQDEIDALLNGVDSGEVDTEASDMVDGEVAPYELGCHDRIIRGRMPTLDMINERYVRYLRISMFNMLHRSIEVTVSGVNMIKFSEYVRGLFMPTSLNLVNILPLRGTGLFVLEPTLVFGTVDNFFGGDGRYHTRIEGRDFTPTENRVIQLLLNILFKDLKKSWEPVLELDFKFLNSEVNPQFANIVSPTEVVVVSKFKMELEGNAGEFHVVMPYSMLEPIREILDTGMQSDQATVDDRWTLSLKEELKQAVIQIDSSMCHTKMTLGEVLNLNKGDVIPIDMPELVTVRAAKTPIFRGVLGSSNGKNSIQYVAPISRPDF